ncbi:Gfo/Idh/MocA family oxidoreductase [Roseiconus nitratireducens]|uniref:Gfo/Idh/MocA family oxidoreductase n=2 Tax=Roseiconus nitratireducens TaxID=2605748 RepID=A0A5M6CTY9_9BACT|nr:Gfo/Idh/MocA family oxidoreductase [Roseiconus nitratireducens]
MRPVASPQRGPSRRDFHKTTLLAATAGGWFSLPQSDLGAAPAVNDRLTAAVIGCGGMATIHAQHQLEPHFHIAAICDVDQTRAEAYRAVAPDAEVVGPDYRDVLERDEIDVVFVTTPDHWHAKITVDALRAGKDVYCEKPLTFSVDEGRVIESTLAATDRILQVGTQQRSDPNFQTAVALARSGRLGAVRKVTVAIGGGPAGGPFASRPVPSGLDWNRWLGQATMTEYIPERCHGNFRWWYEYSGGKLTDWGAHHVDIAMWALGTAAKGKVRIEVVRSEHPVPLRNGQPTQADRYNTATSFDIRCRMQGGAELIIRDSAPDLGFENGILIECEGGRYFVNRGKLTGKPIEDLSQQDLSQALTSDLRGGRPVMSHTRHFYECVHRRQQPISDAASHVRHLNLCHLANIGQRLGRDVHWDPESRSVIDDPEANRWLRREQRHGFEVV